MRQFIQKFTKIVGGSGSFQTQLQGCSYTALHRTHSCYIGEKLEGEERYGLLWAWASIEGGCNKGLACSYVLLDQFNSCITLCSRIVVILYFRFLLHFCPPPPAKTLSRRWTSNSITLTLLSDRASPSIIRGLAPSSWTSIISFKPDKNILLWAFFKKLQKTAKKRK